MNGRFPHFPALPRMLCCWIVAACLGAGAASAHAQAQAPRKDFVLTHHAEGPFDVKTLPVSPDGATKGTSIGRYTLDKEYHGDLEATAKGEMLGAGNPATGSAGYVALEQVTGTLQGRKGSFALQHFGTMDAGKFELNVRVAPGSGTGELQGIAGSMTITNHAGKHAYALDYTLPQKSGPQ